MTESYLYGYLEESPGGVNCRFEALVTRHLVPVDDGRWKNEYFRGFVREESGMNVVSSEFLVQPDDFGRGIVEIAV